VDELLEKTRRLNRAVQSAAADLVDFAAIARLLSDLLEANVYVVAASGQVRAYALQNLFECSIMLQEVLSRQAFPDNYARGLLKVEETSPNISQEARRCVFFKERACLYENKVTTLVPIHGGGRRLGTLIAARFGHPFSDDDLVLAEHGATVVALELLREEGRQLEERARKEAAVRVAIGTLSYTELEAMRQIFAALKGPEGVVVASRIADRSGITRSVIVNALRKFESAGVIAARSLGMKGTHIRVLNDLLLRELADLPARYGTQP
jgi:transcriptional pleiotropic repressor